MSGNGSGQGIAGCHSGGRRDPDENLARQPSVWFSQGSGMRAVSRGREKMADLALERIAKRLVEPASNREHSGGHREQPKPDFIPRLGRVRAGR
jgi:hypothetical protein